MNGEALSRPVGALHQLGADRGARSHKGLYLMVESPDPEFLARRFGTDGDLLYEGEYGCDIQADDVSGFDLDAGEDPRREKLTAFSRVAAGDARMLFDPAESPLDVNNFLTYLATSATLGDFDGYRHAHNYYVHYHSGAGKWRFLPWGMDRALKRSLAIDESQGLLARRCFDDPACKLEYVRTLRRVVTEFESLDLPAMAARLQARLEADSSFLELSADARSETRKARAKLKAFLRQRPEEVRRQLGCLDAEGNELDRDRDGFGCTDCDDQNAAIHPGAAEACDTLDNDCTGLVDDAPECPCQIESVDGRQFQLCNLPMPWPEAEAFCQAKGSSLARIDSAKVSKALYRKTHRIDAQRWWIGYSDRHREGDFQWSDGSHDAFEYWSRRQPDNGSCNEDCAALKSEGKGRWQDTHCGQPSPFICSPVRNPSSQPLDPVVAMP